MRKKIKSTFVLGSTSTIAKSICIELAKQGCRKFHLVARNHFKNKDLINTLEKKFSAIVTEEVHSLSYEYNLEKPFIPKLDNFDLYLITVGSLGKENFEKTDTIEAMKITATNYLGILPWINEIVKNQINKVSRIWIFSSVAGDRGRPSNFHYGAAKAALTTYCEGLELYCKNKPLRVRVIKAGFIDTPMTKGRVPNLLCLSPSKVARILLKNPNKRGLEYLPWWWKLIMMIVKSVPDVIASRL